MKRKKVAEQREECSKSSDEKSVMTKKQREWHRKKEASPATGKKTPL